MTVERHFEATDRFGITVRGSVEVWRPTDPSDPRYGNPRFAYHNFEFLNTREVCTIDRQTLKDAMMQALASALQEGLGISEPNRIVIERNVNVQIDATLQHCARNPHQYSSDETSSGANRDEGVGGHPQAAQAYQMPPDPQGPPLHQLANGSIWAANNPPGSGMPVAPLSDLGLVGPQDRALPQPERPPARQPPLGSVPWDRLAPNQSTPPGTGIPQNVLSGLGLGTAPQPFRPAPNPGFPQPFRPDYEPYYPLGQFTPHPQHVPGPPARVRPTYPDGVFRGSFDIQSILGVPRNIGASFGLNTPPADPAPGTAVELPRSLLANIGSLPPPQGLLGPLPTPQSLGTPAARPHAGIASVPGLPSGLASSLALGFVPGAFDGPASVDPDQPERLFPYGFAP